MAERVGLSHSRKKDLDKFSWESKFYKLPRGRSNDLILSRWAIGVTLGHIRSILVEIYYYNVETFKVEKKVIFIYTNLGTFGEYILEKYIFISLIKFNLLILSKLIPGWEKKLRDKYESKFDPTQLIQRIKKNRIK